MSTITMIFPVSGYARGAAAARLLTAAPRPWMSEVGVCPATDALRSRIDGTAPAFLLDGRPGGLQSGHEFNRQFKHDTGFPDLRPPV
jgi:hypothetical protein